MQLTPGPNDHNRLGVAIAVDQPTHKTCRCCGEPKPLDAFARNASCSDGRRGTCKDCSRAFPAPVQVSEKVCTKCGQTKPAAEFGRKSRTRDGLQSRCKPCVKVDKAEAWQRNLERNRAKNRESYLANREARIAAQAAWKKANPEKVRQYGRIYRERNPGRDLEDTRRWIAANPERAAENFKRNAMRRRARKLGATIGPIDMDALWNGTCGICGTDLDRDLSYPHPLSKSVDHIVPLSKGGTHEQSNLQWAHLVCNIRKGAKAS